MKGVDQDLPILELHRGRRTRLRGTCIIDYRHSIFCFMQKKKKATVLCFLLYKNELKQSFHKIETNKKYKTRDKIRKVIKGDMNNAISPVNILWNYTGSLATEFSSGLPELERVLGETRSPGIMFTNQCQLVHPQHLSPTVKSSVNVLPPIVVVPYQRASQGETMNPGEGTELHGVGT